MKIDSIPALQDNYIYLISNNGAAVIVDPGAAEPALAALSALPAQGAAGGGAILAAILLTHRHADHIGGVAALRRDYPQAAVYAPAGGGVAGAAPCKGGDVLQLLDGALTLRVIETPGHTLEHIAYVHEAGGGDSGSAGGGGEEGGFMLCGDTLFIGGCGRVFEGTMRQMHDSLAALSALPDATRIYCGHEYTVNNLRFAAAVEPQNAAIGAALDEARRKQNAGAPTVPGTLACERQTNPFLRLSHPAVIQAAQTVSGDSSTDSVAVFTALRRWKDGFS